MKFVSKQGGYGGPIEYIIFDDHDIQLGRISNQSNISKEYVFMTSTMPFTTAFTTNQLDEISQYIVNINEAMKNYKENK